MKDQTLDYVLSGLQSGILIIDGASKIIEINVKAQKIFECLGRDYVGISFNDFISNHLDKGFDDLMLDFGLDFNYRNSNKEFKISKGLRKTVLKEVTINSKRKYLEFDVHPFSAEGKTASGAMVIVHELNRVDCMDMKAKQIKELLIQSRQVFDCLFDTIVILDQEGTIVYLNTGIEEVLKLSRDEHIGLKYSGLLEYSKTYQRSGFSIFRETLKGKSFSNEEIHMVDREGNDVVLVGNSLPLYNNKKEFIGVLGIFRDITFEKEQERNYNRWQERFHIAEKLAVVGEMAAGTAHEIKNPLSSIKGYIQLLETDQLTEGKKEKYLGIVREEIFRLEEIVREFLQLSKPSNVNCDIEEFSLCDVIEKTFTFLAPQIKKWNTNFKCKCPGYPITVKGNLNNLRQVFINIIINALEAMDKDKNCDNKLIIEIGINSKEECALISFIDNGPGLPNEIINKLFSPFATTKKSGTGLGLPVSMQIVQNMGGYLEANNTKDMGACFCLELPITRIKPLNKNCVYSNTTYCERRVMEYG